MNIQKKQQTRKLIHSKRVAVDELGDKAVTHIAAGLFFAALVIASAAVIHLTVREYWQEILAALRGEMPVRQSARPWSSRARTSLRPRPVATVRAVQQHRAAV